MSFGLLPIRIIAGIGFIINGLPKLANIMGTEAEFASKIGLPAALALPVGLLEVIGGIVLIIGVLTRIASILFIILMIGATQIGNSISTSVFLFNGLTIGKK